jgi:hypothetical protein
MVGSLASRGEASVAAEARGVVEELCVQFPIPSYYRPRREPSLSEPSAPARAEPEGT